MRCGRDEEDRGRCLGFINTATTVSSITRILDTTVFPFMKDMSGLGQYFLDAG